MLQYLGMRLAKDQLFPVLMSREYQSSMLHRSLAQEAKGNGRLMHLHSSAGLSFLGQRTFDQVLSVQLTFPGTTCTHGTLDFI